MDWAVGPNQTASSWFNLQIPVLCLDKIALDKGDYTDCIQVCQAKIVYLPFVPLRLAR